MEGLSRRWMKLLLAIQLALIMGQASSAQAPLEYVDNTGGYAGVPWNDVWSIPKFQQDYARLNSIDWYIGASLSASASISNSTNNNNISASINASTSMSVSDISPGFDQRAFASASGSTTIRARSSGSVAGSGMGEVSGTIPSSDFQRFMGTGNITFRGSVPSGTPSVSSGGGTITSRNMSVLGGIRITYNYTWIGQSQADPIVAGTSTPTSLPTVPSGRWVAAQFPAAGLELTSTTVGATITNITLPAGAHERYAITGDSQFIGAYDAASSVQFASGGVTRCQLVGLNATGAVSTLPVQVTFSTPTANIQLRRVAAVTARRVFYKNSGFQSNGGVAAALDSSKSLLSPSSTPQVTTFANVSNYARGINGATLDVLGLAGSNLTAADFVLRALDDSQPSATPPSIWQNALPPSAISVTPGTATTPARIQLEWPDNAIQNSWLQIIVKSNTNTGLAIPAVFYLGHALSEINGTAPYRVTGADLSLVQSGIGNDLVGIGDIRDVNKDRRVTGADLSILQTRISNTILLNNITIPAIGSTEEGAPLASPPPPPQLQNEAGGDGLIPLPPVVTSTVE